MQFIRMVELIFKHKLSETEIFKDAIISQVIYVLKLSLEDQQLVEMAIYSLQILLNAISIHNTIRYLDRFLSLAI